MPEAVGRYGLYMGVDDPGASVQLPEKWVIQDPAADREKAKAVSLDYTPETEEEFIAAKQIERKYFGLEDYMTAEQIVKDNEDLRKIAGTRMGEMTTADNTDLVE